MTFRGPGDLEVLHSFSPLLCFTDCWTQVCPEDSNYQRRCCPGGTEAAGRPYLGIQGHAVHFRIQENRACTEWQCLICQCPCSSVMNPKNLLFIGYNEFFLVERRIKKKTSSTTCFSKKKNQLKMLKELESQSSFSFIVRLINLRTQNSKSKVSFQNWQSLFKNDLLKVYNDGFH